MNYYEFRSYFGSEGFVGDENPNKLALGKLLSKLADSRHERTNILVHAVKSAKLDMAVNQSHQKNLVQGTGSADIAWALFYWLHLSMPNSEFLREIDRQMLAGKTFEEVADRRVEPDQSSNAKNDVELVAYGARIAFVEELKKTTKLDFPGLEIPEYVCKTLGKQEIYDRGEFSKIFLRIAQILYNPRNKNKVTVENVEEIVEVVTNDEMKRKYTTSQIINFISSRYSVSRVDLISHRRARSIVFPRQVGMYLAHEMTHDSLGEIADKFGGRDHSTVLHAIRKIGQLANDDSAFGRELAELEDILLNATQASV